MSTFQYFLPRVQRNAVNLALPDVVGLGYAFDGERPFAREVTGSGPGGKSGVMIARDDQGLGYYPDRQTAVPHPAARTGEGDVIWVVSPRDNGPGPEDLRRRRLLDGDWLELNDGRQWYVPLIRYWHAPVDGEGGGYELALPRAMGADPEAAKRGEFILSWGSIDQRYRHLVDLAAEYSDWFFAEEDERQNHRLAFVAALTEAAVNVLAANYRVSLAEVTLLNLLESQGVLAQEILNRAALDWPRMEAWLQKKTEAAAAGSSSNAGPEAGPSPDTSPPTPTTSPSAPD